MKKGTKMPATRLDVATSERVIATTPRIARAQEDLVEARRLVFRAHEGLGYLPSQMAAADHHVTRAYNEIERAEAAIEAAIRKSRAS